MSIAVQGVINQTLKLTDMKTILSQLSKGDKFTVAHRNHIFTYSHFDTYTMCYVATFEDTGMYGILCISDMHFKDQEVTLIKGLK